MNLFSGAGRLAGGCPSAELLKDFWAGRLSDHDLDSVAEHLSQCERCSVEMQRLADSGDTIDSCLRRSHPFRTAVTPAEIKADVGNETLLGQQSRIGQYLLQEKLGAGGMGVVY
ncbi:MAG: hypothetical protein MI861_04120, partial [Pirellulales bacterium]|nr:hypothetical protein [Pirellulales bacterium]